MALTFSRQLVLASKSPRRRELLESLGWEFIVHPGNFEEKETLETSGPAEELALHNAIGKAESAMNQSAEELALHNAIGKAQSITRHFRDALIIGVDTVVAFNEHLLGKPKDEEDARRILRLLSNTTHKVVSAICIIDSKNGKNISAIETTMITLDRLEEADIEAYIRSGEGEDKAGGYAIQGLGALFCKRIEGDYFNVVGLPVYRLRKLLGDFGVKKLI